MRWRKCIQLDLDWGLFPRGQENEETPIPTWHSPNAGECEQQVKGRKVSAPMRSCGLAFTCDTYFDVLCLRKGKKIHFYNIIQKASTPISKINGKTSQSKLSSDQHLPWNSAAVATLVLPPLVSPLSALSASGCQGHCWEVTTDRFDKKNDND